MASDSALSYDSTGDSSSLRRMRLRVPAIAGYTHAAAWLAALAAGWGVLPELGDSAAEVAAAYGDHQAAATTQSLLNHGVAAAAVGAVAVVLLARGRRLAGTTAALAAVLAFGQLALEQGAIATGDVDRAGSLFDLSLRVDGIKMLAFGVVAVTTAQLLSTTWQRALTYTTAAALAASGVAYATLTPGLADTAFLSLPLLLIWFAALGARLTRS